MPDASRFLLLHGLTGSGPEHWQPWLAFRLRKAGHEVRFPELPEPDRPQPTAWDEALRAELEALRPGPGSTVIGHSLGAVLWLRHAVAARGEDPVERVLLVAPPCEGVGLPEVERFLPVPTDAAAVAAAAGSTRLVCSDDDPACPTGAAIVYGEPLGVPVDLLPSRGHINAESGLGPWPDMEAWCLGGRESLEPG
jgi:predicted alpha/beta hydrolase family esterase